MTVKAGVGLLVAERIFKNLLEWILMRVYGGGERSVSVAGGDKRKQRRLDFFLVQVNSVTVN